MKIYSHFLKRFFDIIFSIFFIIVLSPFLLTIALLIYIKDGKPVFFKQERGGYKNSIFMLYKFKTMNNKKDSQGNLLPDYKRMTKLGTFLRKYSLDELPGLLNVIKGEMSLVGPRPFMAEYLPLYNKEQARRHDVKPGITGWAQVNGRNAISWEQKFELDIWYVKHQSFSLDMKIIWLTLVKVIKKDGVDQQQEVTMEKFTGSKK